MNNTGVHGLIKVVHGTARALKVPLTGILTLSY